MDDRKDGESLMVEKMPEAEKYNEEIIDAFESVKEIISGVRNIRNENNIAQKEQIELKVKGHYKNQYDACIVKMANLSDIQSTETEIEGAVTFMVKSAEFYIELGDLVDVEEELKKLQEELDYNKGFLNSVIKKLSNERFVNNAPEKVVNIEKKKKEDAESKIKVLEERIASLKK
jgi:valyl-tRNA synthetase